MAEPWNQWYPHDIDTWQGSGNIQALSDTAYRAVHNIMQDMWKQEDCSLPCDQKVLRKASRVADRWESCKEEVLDYFDHMENGSITSNVLRRKWMKAKEVYEARQNAAKKTNKTKPVHGEPSKASRSAQQSAPIAPRSADTLTVTDTSTDTKTTTKTLASTAIAVPVARGKPVCTLPLNKGEHEVFEADVQVWQPLYPAVDVRQELRSIKGWCLSNPTRRKTKDGIARFINSWLSRAQNEAKPGGGNGNRNYSKTGGNLSAAAGALAILEQAERNHRPADEVQPEAGSGGESGDLSHLRAGSIELRD